MQARLKRVGERGLERHRRRRTAPARRGGHPPAVRVLTDDPDRVRAEGRAHHLAEVPRLVALEARAAAAGRGRVADVRVVRPHDDARRAGVGREPRADAQQRRRHVLVARVPRGLRARGLGDALAVVLVGRDEHLAVLLGREPLGGLIRLRLFGLGLYGSFLLRCEALGGRLCRGGLLRLPRLLRGDALFRGTLRFGLPLFVQIVTVLQRVRLRGAAQSRT